VVAKKEVAIPGSGIGAKSLIDTPLNTEVSKSFLEYSMSVVYSRALPSIIDGLKPVQRRILFSMQEEGYTADKEFVKSAKPVSSTMGNYHPHGDSSIYMALVKLAQPFYLNIPLVEGYGNFGDVTGSGAAASRYTECKLSKEATLLLSELREKTVPMRPNYSDDSEEPEYLPVQFPNLLVNGQFGIAVGFASNFAQHNGAEAINAAKYLLKNPNATVQQLMKYIPGPDFPTGGQIIGDDGIIKAYETGQGIIKIRSTYTIVPIGRGKHEIVFTELPHGAKTETIIEKIKDNIKLGKLSGIADASDLTDHEHGLKFVVEVKTGVNPKVVASELFRLTPLEESFGINNTCLVKGEPKIVGLVEILQSFLDHRVDIVTRRSQFRKDKREAELHLIEGLLKALANVDEVIKIIRGAATTAEAHEKLVKRFKVDDIQAAYILDIQLRRLTKFDQIELNNRKAKLQSELTELNKILTDDTELKAVINKELDEVKKIISHPRRSVIVGGALAEHVEAAKSAAANVNFEVEDTAAVIGVYADGSLKRVDKEDLKAIKAVRAGGKLNPVVDVVPARSRGKVILVTNKGRGYRVDTLHINEKALVQGSSVVSLSAGEKVIAVAPVEDEKLKAGVGVWFSTRNGAVKITSPDYPVRSDDFDMITVDEGDSIVSARWVKDLAGAEIALVSSDTSMLKFDASKVRPQGRSGGGVAGIKLAEGQKVIAAAFLNADELADAQVYTYTGTTVKLTPYAEYPAKGRATGGVRTHKLLKGEVGLDIAGVGTNLVVADLAGASLELPAVDKRRDGSGVKTVDLPAVVGRG
jgi:DNA gyrase subunit A